MDGKLTKDMLNAMVVKQIFERLDHYHVLAKIKIKGRREYDR